MRCKKEQEDGSKTGKEMGLWQEEGRGDRYERDNQRNKEGGCVIQIPKQLLPL
jgi:hypothetical protein